MKDSLSRSASQHAVTAEVALVFKQSGSRENLAGLEHSAE